MNAMVRRVLLGVVLLGVLGPVTRGRAQLAELPGLLFIGSIQAVAPTPLPSPPSGS